MLESLRKNYRAIKKSARVFKILYWKILNICYALKWLNIQHVPLVINNFNRLTIPVRLVESMRACGFKNIIILDNNSTYPPLLEFYQLSGEKIIRSSVNYGHLALWKSGLYRRFKWNYFIYTDSDVLPIEECPKDFINYFKKVLDSDVSMDKIGFGIKTDDLPDSFSLKNSVINYEKVFWQHETSPGVFKAKIDTTFALYKPFSGLKLGETHTLAASRLGYPYLLRHLPWYTDSANLTDEEKFVLKTSSNSSSIAKQYRGNGVY